MKVPPGVIILFLLHTRAGPHISARAGSPDSDGQGEREKLDYFVCVSYYYKAGIHIDTSHKTSFSLKWVKVQ